MKPASVFISVLFPDLSIRSSILPHLIQMPSPTCIKLLPDWPQVHHYMPHWAFRLELGWICCKDVLERYQLPHRTRAIPFGGIGECIPTRTKSIIVHVFTHSIKEGVAIRGCDFVVWKPKRILVRQHYRPSSLKSPSWIISWLTGGYFARSDPCCMDALFVAWDTWFPGCRISARIVVGKGRVEFVTAYRFHRYSSFGLLIFECIYFVLQVRIVTVIAFSYCKCCTRATIRFERARN